MAIVMRHTKMDVKLVIDEIYKDGNVGSVLYVDKIEKKHPGYINYLYCYATNTLGPNSSVALLSSIMHKKVTHQERGK